ncbi:uncharacterized protein B0H18DRAFT_1118135 [Fomitopsis serialis]|uniref:uncharacterized protein n=1 Tax=Fomitopsis serialis TaxID=139415 RepID=UPI0020083F16|nr:uncharacterized protein B0H18DRAFT_1118135 [Neoantrodia serialis]KAH9928114.1 hypothetical protein B0H18DRAFT_1118135 [Neoantrodia serialis]
MSTSGGALVRYAAQKPDLPFDDHLKDVLVISSDDDRGGAPIPKRATKSSRKARKKGKADVGSSTATVIEISSSDDGTNNRSTSGAAELIQASYILASSRERHTMKGKRRLGDAMVHLQMPRSSSARRPHERNDGVPDLLINSNGTEAWMQLVLDHWKGKADKQEATANAAKELEQSNIKAMEMEGAATAAQECQQWMEEAAKQGAELNEASAFVKKLIESMTCAICSSVYSRPIVTQCGHAFCWSCLYDWLRSVALHNERTYGQEPRQEYTCPQCRTVLTEKPYEDLTLKDIALQVALLTNEGGRPTGELLAGVWDHFF